MIKTTGAGADFTKISAMAAPIGAMAISFLVLLLIVWPKFSEVLRLRADNEQLAVRASAMQQKVQSLQSRDAVQLEEQLIAAEQLLPSDKGVFSFVYQIERAAGASGVLLSRVEVAPGAVGEGAVDKPTQPAKGQDDISALAGKIQVKVSATADYKSFLQFLNNLLAAARVMSFRDLNIASSGGAESSQIKVTLVTEAFFKPLPKQLASVESPIEELTEEEEARLAEVEATGFIAAPPTVPQVPLGRTDLFAPF